jgi:hypothetical protein
LVSGSSQAHIAWVSPNMMVPGLCFGPTGTALNMPAAFPGGTDFSGPIRNYVSASTISTGGTTTFDPSSYGQFYATVTTSSAFTIALLSGVSPPANRTASVDIIIYNNSGGALGTITWPAGWLWEGTWVAPANGKRRRVTLNYSPSLATWIANPVSAQDW